MNMDENAAFISPEEGKMNCNACRVFVCGVVPGNAALTRSVTEAGLVAKLPGTIRFAAFAEQKRTRYIPCLMRSLSRNRYFYDLLMDLHLCASGLADMHWLILRCEFFKKVKRNGFFC
ncbi:hypothetical protein ACFQ3K_12315 [Brucella gallinifaecis]|uniref:Uncharacterized protein n=1 Tax=Brucella gallinifaecis TaxID=215590 RepID=A0A502BL37_9HYPH|nr:hypothetical protein [Brucella gallinifaecis]TPF74764.1 hypothetical protein FHY56_12145 [Brucella gallinifaecis]